MDARLRMRTEIETIHGLLDDLDYYRIMQLRPECRQDAIGIAFRNESRRLHPDRMSALGDEAIRNKANDIYRLVQEAYRTLKDPEARARYDQLLEAGVNRMTDEAQGLAQMDKRGDDPEFAANHPKAEKYWKMALRDWKDEQYKSCVMNIKFAMNFEPDNDTFKEWFAKAKEALAEADSKKEKNPYKLRII